MSIKNVTFVNPEPITVKGIKTYNPKLLKVYTDKSGDEYKFDAVEEKTTGTALGTIYKKQHQLDTEKKWMGKVGLPRGVFRDDPEKRINRSQEELNLDAIFEKLAYDLFQELGRGLFEVPKTHLSHQPIANNFSPDNIMVETWSDLGIHESLRIMSYYLKGYEDFKNAQTLDGDKPIEFMNYLEKYKRPPEKLFTPEGKLVPLNGLMGLLAVGRCLCDTDLLGGKGENAGFQWIRNEEKEIVGARAVKIDPGLAFKFTNDSDADDPCENWVLNTYHKLGESNHLGDLKDLQTSTSNFETRILWDALSPMQQKEFVAALLNTSRYVNSDEELRLLFFREKKFFYSEKAYMPEEIATKFQEQMKGWIHWQLEIYKDPLEDFLERHPEQLLRIRYIDDLGEVPIPMSERSLPIRELFSELALVIPGRQKRKENKDIGLLESETETIQIDQLFPKGTKKAIVTGESGTGKSTLCQKIAHDWASGRLFSGKFDAVFWIPLRKLNKKVLTEEPVSELANYVVTEILKKPGLKASVLDLIEMSKVLFVLDGFDEANDEVKAFLKPIFEEQRFHLLLTARLETDRLPNWIHIKNMGFSAQHIKQYIEQFFGEKRLGFFNKIKEDPILFALAKNPFQLQMLCHLEKEGLNTGSRSQLYQTMVTQMIKWESGRIERQIDEGILLPIGKASYLAWIKEGPLLPEHFHEVLEGSPYTFDDCIQSGPMREGEFAHASIEEYLIAKHLSSVSDEELGAFLSKAYKQKKSHNILRFLFGILYEKNPEKAWKFFDTFPITEETFHVALECLNDCGDLIFKLSKIQDIIFNPENIDKTIETSVQKGYFNLIKCLDAKKPGVLEKFRFDRKSTIFHFAAQYGNIQFMDWMYSKAPKLLKTVRKDGITPLHNAAKWGQIEAIEWLLEKDPSLINKIRSTDGATVFFYALFGEQIETMKWLLDRYPHLLQKRNKIGVTVMHNAAFFGRVQMMKWFHKEDPSLIQQVSKTGESPLHLAAQEGNILAMEWLHKKDASHIQRVTNLGYSTLHSAAQKGNVDAMVWLHGKNPSLINIETKKGCSPLHIAAQKGNLEAIQCLFKLGPHILYAPDIEGQTALHYAAESGCLEAVKYLVEKGPNLPRILDNKKWNALDVAKRRKHKHIVEFLKEK